MNYDLEKYYQIVAGTRATDPQEAKAIIEVILRAYDEDRNKDKACDVGPDAPVDETSPLDLIPRAWDFSDGQSITILKRKYNVDAAIWHARDLPVREIDIRHVYYAFCAPCNDNFASFLSHVRMVNEADLNYPLIYSQYGALIDGKHRLGKALLTGQRVIRFKRFEIDPPAIYTETE